MNLLDNFTDFREQTEHNFDHIVVFDWVLVKSLMGSNCFVSPAPMVILLSLCLSVKFSELKLGHIDFIKKMTSKLL